MRGAALHLQHSSRPTAPQTNPKQLSGAGSRGETAGDIVFDEGAPAAMLAEWLTLLEQHIVVGTAVDRQQPQPGARAFGNIRQIAAAGEAMHFSANHRSFLSMFALSAPGPSQAAKGRHRECRV